MNKACSKPNKEKNDLLLPIILVGVFTALACGLVFLGYLSHIDSLSGSSTGVILSNIIAKAGLVVLEAIFCFIISFLAVVIFALKDKKEIFKNLAFLSLCLKVFLLIIIYIPYRGKWYYILDPAVNNGAILIVILSGIQLILQILFVSQIFRDSKVKEQCEE